MALDECQWCAHHRKGSLVRIYLAPGSILASDDAEVIAMRTHAWSTLSDLSGSRWHILGRALSGL